MYVPFFISLLLQRLLLSCFGLMNSKPPKQSGSPFVGNLYQANTTSGHSITLLSSEVDEEFQAPHCSRMTDAAVETSGEQVTSSALCSGMEDAVNVGDRRSFSFEILALRSSLGRLRSQSTIFGLEAHVEEEEEEALLISTASTDKAEEAVMCLLASPISDQVFGRVTYI